MTALSPDPRTIGTPAPERRSHMLLGGVLVAAGAVLLLSEAGWLDSPWPALPALLLLLVGGAVVVEGLRGVWNGTLIGIGVVLAVVAALSTTAANTWHMTGGGVGDRIYAPQSDTELQEQYELGAGNLVLDLRQLEPSEGTTSVAIDVGMGVIEVRVDEGAAVDVTADSGTGEVVIFGSQQGGVGVDRTYQTPGYEDADPRLQLDLSVGMGRIEVTR